MERKRPFWIELLLPAAVAILGVVYYVTTMGLSRQAVFFPHSMMVVMSVLGVLVLGNEFLDRRRARPDEAAPAAGWRETAMAARRPMTVFGLAVVYYGLIIALGYFPATVVFLFASLLIFRVGVVRAALLSLAFPGALYLVFVLLFHIRVGS